MVEGRFKKLPADLITQDIARLLIITDEGIQSSGLLDHFIDGLEEKNISYTIYNQVQPNPPIKVCEEIAIIYNKFHADAMLAIGGALF